MQNTNKTEGPFDSLVVLGESTVEGGGWLAKTEERWADILADLIQRAQEQPLRYYNAGIGASVIAPSSPGYQASTKPSASERFDQEVITHKPDLVVIAYGLNDMRAGMPLELFRNEMEDMICRLRKVLSPMIVLGNIYHMSAYNFYPPFDKGSVETTKQYNAMLLDVAKANDCVYADVWQAEGQCDYVINPDTVHANKIGNMLIAHKVFEAIVHASSGIAKNIQERDNNTEWTRRARCRQTQCVENSHKSKPGQ